MAKMIDYFFEPIAGEWGDEVTGDNIGVPVLRTTNFMKDGRLSYDDISYRIINVDKCSNKILQAGDIIIEKSGGTPKNPVGRTVFFDKDDGNTYFCNNFTAILRVKDKKVNPKYLFYILQQHYKTGKIIKYQHKTNGIANLKISKYLESMDIELPERDVQDKHVEMMEFSQGILDKQNTMLDKLGEIVKARFVEMFGDPQDNALSWRKMPLSHIIINANNGMARRGNDEDGNIVMRLVELQDGYIDYSNTNRIILNDSEKKKYLLKDKDFLFARVNGNPDNVGRCAVFYDIGEDVYHNDHIIRVHFDETLLNGVFASALFNNAYGKQQLKSKVKTSAGQYTVSQDGIGEIVTILPPIELQNQFADFVHQVDKSKFRLQTSINKVESIRNSLMQQYFSIC